MDNNLMASAGATGDIWSTGFLSFESPLKDLLDTNNYTLEQLLAEDELLQELRGMHPQLLLFFNAEVAVTRLVQHIIRDVRRDAPLVPLSITTVIRPPDMDTVEAEASSFLFPPPEEADKKEPKSSDEEEQLRNIRYPYMACEAICCEISSILDALVDGHVATELLNSSSSTPSEESTTTGADQENEGDGTNTPLTNGGTNHVSSDARPPRLLDLLCSVLVDTDVGELDDYRAGYLDKILSVLCRTRPQAMNAYVQEKGIELLHNLQKHLYSHSIMQIVQRLLLPSGGGGMSGGEGVVNGDDDDDQEKEFRCTWSELPESIDLLLNSLLRPQSDTQLLTLDEAQNASEVLMTIIQNSPLSARPLICLTTRPALDRIIDAASTIEEEEALTPHESRLTSAMNVLESLILQLGGYGTVSSMGPAQPMPEANQQVGSEEGGDDDNRSIDLTEQSTTASSETLIELLPGLLERLCHLLQHPSTKSWTSPMQFAQHAPQSLLGMSRLKMVRLLESLVLLGHPEVDHILCESPALQICLDLFWEFAWCSMLHQSVANLLVHVFEGANERAKLQKYFLEECSLLERLMDSFENEENEGGVVSDARVIPGVDKANETKSTSSVLVEGDEMLPVLDDVNGSEQQAVSLTVGAAQDEEQLELEKPTSVDELARKDPIDESAEEIKSHIPSFRLGYMGHVIIVCQALVHASTRVVNEPPDMDAVEGGMSSIDLEMSSSVELHGINGKGDSARSEYEKQGSATSLDFDQDDSDTYCEDDAADPDSENDLIIVQLIQSSVFRSRWEEFVTNTLSAESAIQLTLLGGASAGNPDGDPLHSHAPDMNGLSDFEQDFVQGKGILVTGEAIDMDDNDLDMAATMMEALGSLANGPEEADNTDEGNFSKESHDYIFDDPLGCNRFAQDDSDDGSDDDGSDGEPALIEDVEPKQSELSSKEVDDKDAPPVMNLFTGNFYDDKPYDEPADSSLLPVNADGVEQSLSTVAGETSFSPDFAVNFDDAFASAETSSSDSDEAPDYSIAVADEFSREEMETVPPDAEDIFGATPPHHLLLAEDDETDKQNEGNEDDDEDAIGPFQQAESSITSTAAEMETPSVSSPNTEPEPKTDEKCEN